VNLLSEFIAIRNILDFLCDPPNSSVRTVWGNGRRRMNYRRHAKAI
jgi:hypothetical protein